MNITRRQMITRTARAAVALSVCHQFASNLSGQPKDSKRFKIGACQWNLGRNDATCMSLAKEIGLDGVQVTMGSISSGLNMRNPEVQQSYLNAARTNNVKIGSLALDATNSVPVFAEPKAGIWLLDSIDVCRALGVKVVLVAMFGTGELRASDKQAVDRLIGLLKEVGPRAEEAGVIIGLENYLSAKDNMSILEQVNSPAVQVYYDVGNSTDKGYDILSEIKMLGKNICGFHAKDGPSMLGQGRIDFRKVRQAMDNIGYSGWTQIEAPAPNGLVQDYKTQLRYLRDIFDA